METDIEQAKRTALNNAAKFIAGCLQRPEQLDKIEQLRRRTLRNKASVDTRLKAAVQGQLDGIRSGLQELKSALKEIEEVKKSVEEVKGIFLESDVLMDKLQDVRNTYSHYSQLYKTNEHLKQIFNVPETIKSTTQLLDEGKLLHAHKNIMELEATRDEILFEVHQLESREHGRSHDQTPLYVYFAEVDKISERLGKQVSTTLAQTLSAARSNPTELVTALRIVEREERADNRAAEQQRKTKFRPPGRPKLLKQRCLAVIRKAINNRLEGNQMELSNKADKMWLVRHLERMRAFILQDLITVKYLVTPCFPPDYEIFKEYLSMYHSAASKTIEELALASNEPNECVILLMWIKDYYGPDLMGNVEIAEETKDMQKDLPPLLSSGVLSALYEAYIRTTERNIQSWLTKMVETERQDWTAQEEPEGDTDGFFQTSLPVIMFQMIDQNLQVAAQIEEDVKLKTLDIAISSVAEFLWEYTNAIKEYKTKYFVDRSQLPLFVSFMIAIINNCLSISEFTQQLKSQVKAEHKEESFTPEREKGFDELLTGFDALAKECCGILLDGVFLDLDKYLVELITRKWFGSSFYVETIIMTLRDYATDYEHIKPKYYSFVMEKAEERVILEYVKAILSRRITFRQFEERKDCAQQIVDEAAKIAAEFTRLAALPPLEETHCAILPAIAEVLKLKDPTIVSLEISGLSDKYPDFRAEHALALLALRGDLGRSESKQMVTDLKIKDTSAGFGPNEKGIFSQIVLAGTIVDKLEAKIHK